MHRIQRSAIKAIHALLKRFPCVAILGARQVGKTTLLQQLLPRSPLFDLEKRSDFERISRDPEFFLSQYERPIILDEAQSLKALFPALRVAIDAKRQSNGRYLISGSSSPDLLSHITESLAGRIALFELGGFTLEELRSLPPSPFYSYIQQSKRSRLAKMVPRYGNAELLKFCLYGGYPEPNLKREEDEHFFSLWMENYFRTYIQRDIRNLFPGLNLNTYQRFITMLAASSGQLLNASEYARSLDVSQPTAKSYFHIAEGTYLWRHLPSYQKNLHKRVVKMPKGHFRDSGLLNHLLGNKSVEQLHAHPMVGRLWEGFVVEQLLKGFQNQLISVTPYYYRTSNQAEIDLILEGDFGLLPIEIKLGTSVHSKQLIALESFIKEHRLDFGLVLNNAQEPAWLSKTVLQLPVGCL